MAAQDVDMAECPDESSDAVSRQTDGDIDTQTDEDVPPTPAPTKFGETSVPHVKFDATLVAHVFALVTSCGAMFTKHATPIQEYIIVLNNITQSANTCVLQVPVPVSPEVPGGYVDYMMFSLCAAREADYTVPDRFQDEKNVFLWGTRKIRWVDAWWQNASIEKKNEALSGKCIRGEFVTDPYTSFLLGFATLDNMGLPTEGHEGIYDDKSGVLVAIRYKIDDKRRDAMSDEDLLRLKLKVWAVCENAVSVIAKFKKEADDYHAAIKEEAKRLRQKLAAFARAAIIDPGIGGRTAKLYEDATLVITSDPPLPSDKMEDAAPAQSNHPLIEELD